MTAFSEKYFTTNDGLRLFYREFSAAKNNSRCVMCLHGLTRNSRDFIELATHLQTHYRVIAPDMRGRGRSDYDAHWQNYQPGIYVQDMFALIDALNIEHIAIIGTSLGALMAMIMGAQQPQRITGMVLNDAGPAIDPRGLARIAQYAGAQISIRDWQDATRYIKSIYAAALPDLDDEAWLAFTKLTYRENENGIPVADYDLNIGAAFRGTYTSDDSEAPKPENSAADLWPAFALGQSVPTLTIRGEHSDILSEETVQRMHQEKPAMQSLVVPNRGHAPLLNETVCVAAIDRFLEGLPV